MSDGTDKPIRYIYRDPEDLEIFAPNCPFCLHALEAREGSDLWWWCPDCGTAHQSAIANENRPRRD